MNVRKSIRPSAKRRSSNLISMHDVIVTGHERAVNYIEHLLQEEEILPSSKENRRITLRNALDEYAGVTLKFITILDKLYERESKLRIEEAESGADAADSISLSAMEWQMLSNHIDAQRNKQNKEDIS